MSLARDGHSSLHSHTEHPYFIMRDKAFANKETKGYHAPRTALRWSSFFTTTGRWLWGPRTQGPGTVSLRFQISQSCPERKDAPGGGSELLFLLGRQMKW